MSDPANTNNELANTNNELANTNNELSNNKPTGNTVEQANIDKPRRPLLRKVRARSCGYPISQQAALAWADRLGEFGGKLSRLRIEDTPGAIIGYIYAPLRSQGGTFCFPLNDGRYLIGTRMKYDQVYADVDPEEEDVQGEDKMAEEEWDIYIKQYMIKEGVVPGEFMTIRGH